MADPSTTVPGSISVLSGEMLPISIDFELLVAAGQTPSAPTASLYDITNGSPGTLAPGSLSGAASLVGTIVTQTVTALVAGHRYRLMLGLTAAAGVVWQAAVTLECPY